MPLAAATATTEDSPERANKLPESDATTESATAATGSTATGASSAVTMTAAAKNAAQQNNDDASKNDNDDPEFIVEHDHGNVEKESKATKGSLDKTNEHTSSGSNIVNDDDDISGNEL